MTQEQLEILQTIQDSYKEGCQNTIDKACEWLESVNLDYYQIREGVFSKELVLDFRKAMEE